MLVVIQYSLDSIGGREAGAGVGGVTFAVDAGIPVFER
jgi:hypothetical protein